jgi:hypothetical protein
MVRPVLRAVACCLIHVPDLVRYGAEPFYKPARRTGGGTHSGAPDLAAHLRRYDTAVAYAPNQAFIGNLRPEQLNALHRPWYEAPLEGAQPDGPHGTIMPQDIFYGFLRAADDFSLLLLAEDFLAELTPKLTAYPLFTEADAARLGKGTPLADIEKKIAAENALPLWMGQRLAGCIQPAHQQDHSLGALALLENLVVKASALVALRHLFAHSDIAPGSVDYLLSCSEEAVGDRFNRGGGNMAKAVAELAGCLNATGADVKSFCSAPAHAAVQAGALVQGGVFNTIAIVGGGSLAKLGMKYDKHLEKGVPVLEDMLGAIAYVIGPDDGVSPVLRLEAVGRHTIKAGFSQEAITDALVVQPLERVGLKITDVDRYATELQNPDITRPFERGDTARTNYRMIAALAVKRGEIEAGQREQFVDERGMPGFAPSQGHIPVGIAYLGHAREQLTTGNLNRVLVMAKGSLFLGRMTHMSDGMSFLLERQGLA